MNFLLQGKLARSFILGGAAGGIIALGSLGTIPAIICGAIILGMTVAVAQKVFGPAHNPFIFAIGAVAGVCAAGELLDTRTPSLNRNSFVPATRVELSQERRAADNAKTLPFNHAVKMKIDATEDLKNFVQSRGRMVTGPSI